MPLEYAVKREYTIPGLTWYFSAFSVVAIAALTVLNVILQGYDIVTVLRTNPNVTESHWWSTRALPVRSAGECNPVSLPRRSMIMTNSSLFSYELRGVFGANNKGVAGATSYMANPLGSCTVDGIIVEIDLLRRSFQFDIPILCNGPDLPFSLALRSQFSLMDGNPYGDDVVLYYLQNRPASDGLDDDRRAIQRDPHSILNVIAAVDAVSTDFMYALLAMMQVWAGDAPNRITTGGFMVCPGGQNATCQPEEKRVRIPECGMSYPNGTVVGSDTGICPLLGPIEPNFLNMFTVLQDAYHIDFGNIMPSNTLLSMQEFSSRIQPNPVLSKFSQSTPFCSWGLGCAQNSTWIDKILASDPNISVAIPSVLAAGNSSAVAKLDYLCPEFRIKPIGSLLTSVFIGTWSMYMALVGLLGVIGPMLEDRYGRERTSHTLNTPAVDYELKS
ncbi:hypothetical protein RhiJN_02251 [Ceratobasidium sp. AG-Ba]|nr:hypothetical protein RhiJN_02251 [Ceratobasidium sp. AG-Ba]QRW03189.1 hypothetical protein RhiLY_02188 [Ceratobasidium sp. AG-Ba]